MEQKRVDHLEITLRFKMNLGGQAVPDDVYEELLEIQENNVDTISKGASNRYNHRTFMEWLLTNVDFVTASPSIEVGIDDIYIDAESFEDTYENEDE